MSKKTPVRPEKTPSAPSIRLTDAPTLLSLSGSQLCMAAKTDDQSIHLQGIHHQLSLTGQFALSLEQSLSGSASDADKQRLVIIEKQHPWLKGLSSSQITRPLTTTLLGEALGMLFVELTSRCNERCLHCYAESSPERNDFLDMDTIRSVLFDARQLGRPYVQFTGGDPLLHRDLPEIMAYAASLDFQGIEIFTNGLSLSDALLHKLQTFRPRMCFSVYADQPEIHDTVTRVPGSWQRTMHAIRKTLKAGLEVRIGVAIMPENVGRAESMVDFMQQKFAIPAEHIRFDPVKQAGRGTLMLDGKVVHIQPSHAPGGEGPRHGKLCIAADGDVYPCIFARRHSLGNIHKQKLTEILHDLSMQQPALPSSRRWHSCQEQLSCVDCQIIAYTLGDPANEC